MQGLHRADARIGDAVRRLTRPGPRTDLFMRATTDLGSLFMVVPAGAALVWTGRRREAAEVAVAGLLAWGVGQRAKQAFNRRRPYQNEGIARLIPIPSGSSMPSGHAAVAAAVATVLAARSVPARRWPWAVMAVYVPVTRVHLGVHYPGDTMVGVSIGYGLGRGVRAVSGRLAARQAAVAERPTAVDAPEEPRPECGDRVGDGSDLGTADGD